MLFLTIFFGLFFGLFVLILGRLLFSRTAPADSGARPRVSILVAARNEQDTIERCLTSLCRLQYPPELLEILIADDASTDNTAAVVERFIEGKPQFRLLRVRHQLGTARGKSNALAYLCRAASTDYFLFTDADMALHPHWVQTMLAAAASDEQVGIVTGITTAAGRRFGRLQGLDWLFGLNIIRVLSDLGLPITSVGNNMLVTRAAYESIGGYEALAFSITEDLQLFSRIVGQGWHFRNLCETCVLGVTVPQPTTQHLLRQRKRWMKGAVRLPASLSLLFGFYGMFYIVLFWPGLLAPAVLLGIYGAKIICQTLFLHLTLRQVGRCESLGLLLLYEPYLCLLSVAVVGYTLWPGHIWWKERQYQWAEG
ncbi:glycosyltransferase [Hymenobacter psychrotolerans]|uniref:Glycosyltransferase, catalytic subunit of cellulose synthase and poly-beta-1,6-N-acetylglucosamine synthase n=1 Tax=Hymenobacter psychrotolerans DSM 18569 TaxID=1121959 RepID=A0A1M6QAD4_9BACT|nr:glycosyltransferase [Hymenobacter psychrotolerans]SHK17202.1 Glycosyltransferase, catalytic subunit of cellulose synthase and poly-beta-1,6-N-acetylglucosamine synthase [Hymenobacter psychrotolerans DSM 18569]